MLFLYLFITFIAALLIIAALLPGRYNIERTIIIQQPAELVMSKVSDLNYYSQWNPWQQSDPTAQKTITGTPATKGHRYAWEGKKTGVGHLTLQSIDNRHIHFDLEFIKPFQSKANDNWLFEPWGAGETKVTWQNSGKFSWPVPRLMGPVILKGLGRQFEQGLVNLKKMCEA